MTILTKTITIDGPAASGKTTLGKRLADELGYLFFDTGVMYRAVTWVALEKRLDLNNEQSVQSLAEQIDIDVRQPSLMDGRVNDVIAEEKDITWQIRRPEVDANVSLVSAYPGVRMALSLQQRRIGMRGEIVMVGRDIGTVVLPEAEVKLYLDASVEVRAKRRYDESVQRSEDVSYDAILAAMKKRDQIDTTREVAPLTPAEDAIVLDSNELDSDQVLILVKNILSEKLH